MISNDTFDSCSTVEQVKALYRELARKNHPDLGGNTEDMQEVNRLYKMRLSTLDGHESVGSDGNVHTYHYNEETEDVVMEKLAEILKAAVSFPDRIEILLIGLWIWIDGTEKGDEEVKTSLKELGFRWQRHRACWAWKPYSGRSRRSSGDIADLADKYGCKKFAGKARGQAASTRGRSLNRFALQG